jgi:hypothetical protein
MFRGTNTYSPFMVVDYIPLKKKLFPIGYLTALFSTKAILHQMVFDDKLKKNVTLKELVVT